jgi:hypothetical protein
VEDFGYFRRNLMIHKDCRCLKAKRAQRLHVILDFNPFFDEIVVDVIVIKSPLNGLVVDGEMIDHISKLYSSSVHEHSEEAAYLTSRQLKNGK